ncbi:hypothetical protein M011DRAFT_464440 [Sporormia fimetaria CBS 119925]|uniref:Uncharacterized protein n=1 Tax=Sporormia fimetaria CBS 119925 TaxID=1340428 RepID=A0A6A6VLF4_9PLEO|nr:hypothetical protein M011DRAFT_464440 [Sporormia fimetaria CBS 119925]
MPHAFADLLGLTQSKTYSMIQATPRAASTLSLSSESCDNCSLMLTRTKDSRP